MREVIHYLIAHPTEVGTLIYPSQVNDLNYYGFGAFYILGKHKERSGDSYKFHAVHDSQIIQTTLVPYRGSKSFLVATVSGIGSFVFNVQSLPRKQPYKLTHASLEGLTTIRRLRSWNPNELDKACAEHQFYFTGYSPVVGNAA